MDRSDGLTIIFSYARLEHTPWNEVALTRKFCAMMRDSDYSRLDRLTEIAKEPASPVSHAYRAASTVHFKLDFCVRFHAGKKSMGSLRTWKEHRAVHTTLKQELCEQYSACPQAFRDVLAPRLNGCLRKVAIGGSRVQADTSTC